MFTPFWRFVPKSESQFDENGFGSEDSDTQKLCGYKEFFDHIRKAGIDPGEAEAARQAVIDSRTLCFEISDPEPKSLP